MKGSLRALPIPFLCALLWGRPAEATLQTSSNLDLARQLNNAFADLAEKVAPLVVVIDVVQKPNTANLEDEEDNVPDGIPHEFWRYFHKKLEKENRSPSAGEGSGFIIRENGYILTSYHVVEDAESIEVSLLDGHRFKAKLRGSDTQSDLAVLKIDAKGLPAAKLADSSRTRVGEFAIAVGAPFELDYSVTIGHISAKGRSNLILGNAGASMDQDFLQTDASINPGNSGGPLFNLDGEVIGVNSMIRGFHTGIGFAVPSSLAKEISDKLVADGKFVRAWLGVGVRALRETPLQETFKGVSDGLIVSAIQPDGPAAKSELKPGDIITAVAGKAVGTAQQLRAEIRSKPIGQPVTLEVFRPRNSQEGKAVQVKVTLAEWVQKEPILASAKVGGEAGELSNELGFTVHILTHELAARFNLEMKPGVLVMAVENGSPAARKGLKPGDLITSLDQQPITSPQQFREALRKADLKKGVALNLVSGDKARSVLLKKGGE